MSGTPFWAGYDGWDGAFLCGESVLNFGGAGGGIMRSDRLRELIGRMGELSVLVGEEFGRELAGGSKCTFCAVDASPSGCNAFRNPVSTSVRAGRGADASGSRYTSREVRRAGAMIEGGMRQFCYLLSDIGCRTCSTCSTCSACSTRLEG